MFSSLVANVGSMMKHTVYFVMFLLSSIIGIFFVYLGFTGSWDPMTILMSMMGVMGMIGVFYYARLFMAWVQGPEAVDEPTLEEIQKMRDIMHPDSLIPPVDVVEPNPEQ